MIDGRKKGKGQPPSCQPDRAHNGVRFGRRGDFEARDKVILDIFLRTGKLGWQRSQCQSSKFIGSVVAEESVECGCVGHCGNFFL